jgi:uncharacterized membrane protein YebE (DUF533 family)
MFDTKALLDRFLGPGATGAPLGAPPPAAGGLPATQAPARPPMDLGAIAAAAKARLGGTGGGSAGTLAAGAAAGGLLVALLSSKKVRKMAGGAAGYGGAAALGALAHRAWQGWQQRQPDAAMTPQAALPPPATALPQPAEPFELALIRAMIGAAHADGHVDAEERRAIFAAVERAGLDAEAKGFLFDAIARPPAIAEIAAASRTPEQAAELWLAARLAIDPDEAAERAWLEALAHRLALPPGLAEELERQATAPG